MASNTELQCWGDNEDGQTGLLTEYADDDAGSLQVTLGGWHTCMRSDGAGVACFGNNDYGQGDIPAAISESNLRVEVMGAGDHHTCLGTPGGL